MGQTLKVGGTTFTIVGVMAMKGTGLEEGGTDDCVFVPYSTAARLSFTGTVNSYTLTVLDTDRIDEAKTTWKTPCTPSSRMTTPTPWAACRRWWTR